MDEYIYEQSLTSRKKSCFRWIMIIFAIIAVVYNSGYALLTIEDNISLLLLVPMSVLVLSISIFKKKLLKQKMNRYLVVYYGLIISCFFTILYNQDVFKYTSYMRFIFVITLAFSITQVISFYKFIDIYIYIMKIIVIISLIVYVLVNVFHFTMPFPIVMNINGTAYYNGVITFMMTHATERNIGVFWEPGIYCSFLIIAMVIEICFKKKMSKFNVVLFLVAVLTALSTAGYLLLPFIGVLLFNRNRKRNSYITIIINVIFLIIFTFIAFQIDNIVFALYNSFPYVFGKVINMSGSFLTRVSGPAIDWNIFIKSPLFGVGFVNYQTIWRELASGVGVIAQTSTITYFIATLGIGGGLYLYLVVNGIFKLPNLNVIAKLSILMIFIFIVTKEPHQHNVTIFIFLFYFLKLGCRQYNDNSLMKDEGKSRK